jgi:opacity protein-like surface antigen
MTRARWGVAWGLAVAGLLGGRAVGAQTAAAEIAPYAGYMLFDDFIEGPLGSSVGGGSGPVYGLQLALPLTSHLAVVGHVGYADTELRAGFPLVGGIDFGRHTALLFDGAVQLSGNGRLGPFLQAGLGGMRQEITVSGLSTDATSLMLSVGGGVDIALSRGLALRLMAKDYAGAFDFQEATFLDIDGGTMHNVALSAGLRLRF